MWLMAVLGSRPRMHPSSQKVLLDSRVYLLDILYILSGRIALFSTLLADASMERPSDLSKDPWQVSLINRT